MKKSSRLSARRRQRKVILFHFAGCTVEDIARITKLGEPYIRRTLAAAGVAQEGNERDKKAG